MMVLIDSLMWRPMPSSTIDTGDDGIVVLGDPDVGFGRPRKARVEAHRAFESMTQCALPHAERRAMRAPVREETGQEVYVATITFVGE